MRLTKTYEAVVHIFRAYPRPLSLAELFRYAKISCPSLAYSTVFRIVLRLEQEGKIIQIDWRERGSRYEWSELAHHHHIVCQICGTIADLDDHTLEFEPNKVTAATGFSVTHHSIELEGICAKCQALE